MHQRARARRISIRCRSLGRAGPSSSTEITELGKRTRPTFGLVLMAPAGDHAGYLTYPVPDVKEVICDTARVLARYLDRGWLRASILVVSASTAKFGNCTPSSTSTASPARCATWSCT